MIKGIGSKAIYQIKKFGKVMRFDNDESIHNKWKAIVRKNDTKMDDYSTVLKTIKIFLPKPFIEAAKIKNLLKKGLPLMVSRYNRRNLYRWMFYKQS